MKQDERTFYYTQKLIGEIQIESVIETDLSVDVNKFAWVEAIENGELGQAEGSSIAIDTLIENLTGLKEHGSTHVELHWDGDRQIYQISGYFIRPSLAIEIQALTTREKLRKERELEIYRLRAQIKELQSRPFPEF